MRGEDAAEEENDEGDEDGEAMGVDVEGMKGVEGTIEVGEEERDGIEETEEAEEVEGIEEIEGRDIPWEEDRGGWGVPCKEEIEEEERRGWGKEEIEEEEREGWSMPWEEEREERVIP